MDESIPLSTGQATLFVLLWVIGACGLIVTALEAQLIYNPPSVKLPWFGLTLRRMQFYVSASEFHTRIKRCASVHHAVANKHLLVFALRPNRENNGNFVRAIATADQGMVTIKLKSSVGLTMFFGAASLLPLIFMILLGQNGMWQAGLICLAIIWIIGGVFYLVIYQEIQQTSQIIIAEIATEPSGEREFASPTSLLK